MSIWYIINRYFFNFNSVFREFQNVIKNIGRKDFNQSIVYFLTEFKMCYLDTKSYIKLYVNEPKVDLNRPIEEWYSPIEPRIQLFFYLIKQKLSGKL